MSVGNDWLNVRECSGAVSASVISERLNIEGIPNKVGRSGVRGDPTHYIWVPPEWIERAKQVLEKPAIPEDELEKEAMSYPKPDDA